MTGDHPLFTGAFSDLWDDALDMLNVLTALLGPAGTGVIPIGLKRRRRARRLLRVLEAVLRRILQREAQALRATLAGLPKPAARGPRPRDQSPAKAPRTIASFPWPTFSLHEAAPGDASRRFSIDAAHTVTDDHCGTHLVCAQREVARLTSLIVTIHAPGRAIRRMALLLRRRQRRGQSPSPWHRRLLRTGWGPEDTPWAFHS
ncbi:MAG: hypothetical protein AAF253_06810, partial [Pseudomonadota bacterium]